MIHFLEKCEIKLGGVEEVTSIVLGFFFGDLGAIEGIADDRVTEVIHMDANLVGASGFRFDFDEVGAFERLEYSVVSDGFASCATSFVFFSDDGLVGAVFGFGEIGADSTFCWSEVSRDDSEIGFVYFMLLEEVFEFLESGL